MKQIEKRKKLKLFSFTLLCSATETKYTTEFLWDFKWKKFPSLWKFKFHVSIIKICFVFFVFIFTFFGNLIFFSKVWKSLTLVLERRRNKAKKLRRDFSQIFSMKWWWWWRTSSFYFLCSHFRGEMRWWEIWKFNFHAKKVSLFFALPLVWLLPHSASLPFRYNQKMSERCYPMIFITKYSHTPSENWMRKKERQRKHLSQVWKAKGTKKIFKQKKIQIHHQKKIFLRFYAHFSPVMR